VTNLTGSSAPGAFDVTLAFTATGDDRFCGQAKRYEVRVIRGPRPRADWTKGTPVSIGDVTPKPAGEQESLTVTLDRRGPHLFMIRAFDDAENGSAVASVQVFVGR
jgi:hypothetical protein